MYAGRPQDRARLQVLRLVSPVDHHGDWFHIGHFCPCLDLDPQPSQRGRRLGRKFGGKGRQNTIPTFHEHDAGAAGVDMAEFPPEGAVGQIGEAAAQLDPGWTAPRHNERQPSSARVRIGRNFGCFKCR